MDEKVKATEDKVKEILSGIVGESMAEFKDAVTSQIESRVASAVEEKMPKINIHENIEDDAKGGFKGLWHFCRDVARAEKSNNRSVSKELGEWHVKAAGTGMNEGDAQFGGYLVPTEFKNNLLQAIQEENMILPRCTPVPMGTNIVEIPYVNGFDASGGLVYGGIQWKWIDEEAAYSETRMKVGKIQLKLKKCIGLTYASEEILSDSPMSMEGLIQQGFRDGLNFQLNNVILRGTGAGTPLGVLNSPCLVSVAKEAGQAADTIVMENVVKAYSRISNPARAVWIANPEILPQLITMSLQAGTAGIPVFLPANGLAGMPYDVLMGKPLIWCDHASALGDLGDLLFCDFTQYLVGQKAGDSGVRFDTSIHIKFDYGQSAFRFMFRIDGSPWWASALVPAQGAATRSPFVGIAAR